MACQHRHIWQLTAGDMHGRWQVAAVRPTGSVRENGLGRQPTEIIVAASSLAGISAYSPQAFARQSEPVVTIPFRLTAACPHGLRRSMT